MPAFTMPMQPKPASPKTDHFFANLKSAPINDKW